MLCLKMRSPFMMFAKSGGKSVCAIAAAAMMLLLAARPAFAVDATWDASPADNQWVSDNGADWTPTTAPNNEGDTAVFMVSSTTSIVIPGLVGDDGTPSGPALTFTSGASSYTFTSLGELVIGGAGITNNSGVTQFFIADVNPAAGGFFFSGSATAGSNTVFTANGSATSGLVGGFISFYNNSNAGSGSFTLNGGSVSGAFGSSLQFSNSSSGGNGTFVVNGGSTDGAFGANLYFYDTSTAGSGTYTANGSASSGTNGYGGSITLASTSAGSATFIINGANAGGTTANGKLYLTGTATAANGTFTANGGGSVDNAYGGYIIFSDTSTAGNGKFTTTGPSFSGANAGTIYFEDHSTAGSGSFSNNGGTEAFENNSTAGNGIFLSLGGTSSDVSGGSVQFFGSSTAGNGAFTTYGGTASGDYGGNVFFYGTSTAGNGSFTNNAATASGALGGNTTFNENSTASNNTYTNNGATVSGAQGGYTSFTDSSMASSSTLIANGGSAGGGGGGIYFAATASGGTASVKLYGNGFLDISELTAPSLVLGSLEGSGNVFLGKSGLDLTVGSNNASTTFSGVIQDGGIHVGVGAGGSFTKIGTGTLTLTGSSTYTGSTLINEGLLELDGSIASPNTTVTASGRLGGTGIIGGNVVNGGVVSPGDAPGTLSILGNYTQSGAGSLHIQIAGLAAGQHDLLAVSGTASLAGSLQLVRLNNFALNPGDKVEILTAGKGVTGTFSNVDTGSILNATVVYQPDDVLIEFLQGSYSTFATEAGLTPNQHAVAILLDGVASDPRTSPVITFLNNQPLGNLPPEFDLIAPEELTALYQISFSDAAEQETNLENRMQDIRNGSTGFASNLSAPDSKNAVTPGYDGKSVVDGKVSSAFQPTPGNRWGVFASGNGDFVNVDGDYNSRGYDFSTGELTLGVDYRANPTFAFGLALDYAHTWTDLTNSGRIDADTVKLGAFATWYRDGLYVNGYLGGGYNNYDTHRAALLGVASGNTDGGEFDSFLTTGYDFHKNAWTYGPYGSLAYTYVGINSYTEAGSLAPLNIVSQNQDSLTTNFGWQASYAGHVNQVAVTPQFRAGWLHQYAYKTLPFDAQLASGAGGVFSVQGPSAGRNSAVVEATVNVQWSPRVSTFFGYDDAINNAYRSQNVSSGVNISF